MITKAATHRSGHQIFLVFQLAQHFRDELLIRKLAEYLGCGNIYVDASAVEYRVTKFSCASYIDVKIIPFFSKNKILGVKLQDFKD